jgi:uncharacterized protein (DUF1800 family)
MEMTPVLSFARLTRPSLAAVVLLASTIGCSSLQSRSQTDGPSLQPLSETERIAHVLSRLTFGARPGDADRVRAMGVKRWIDQQLRPAKIDDTVLTATLAAMPTWGQPVSDVAQAAVVPARVMPALNGLSMSDSANRVKMAQLLVRLRAPTLLTDNFYAGKIIHAQLGERQLLEVVSDFWENHFSVYSGKMPSRTALIEWDRDVLRPHALGKFRDLLGAVAHSPAMLFYLDNHLSTRRGLNENYARELMELHTLGVDGGYTQKDVQEVARALTGWTIDRAREPSAFVFRPALHDTSAKTVLGHTLAPGRGIEDGEEVLDILARHPSTARYIAFKLARRLVSDDPPPALVSRAAAAFSRTDGDISEVVRTIVTSPEFFSRAAFRAKVKTPFELVVSARRALGAPADTTPQTARLIARLGQPTFGWQTPDGWPERGGAWINSATIYARIKFGHELADGRVPFVAVRAWPDWKPLSASPLSVQVDGVVDGILGGCADPVTRETMLGIRAEGSGSATVAIGDGEQRVRELLAIALASPEFQRR